MRCLWHRWGRWEDAGTVDTYAKSFPGLPRTVRVTYQQRRCARCNRVVRRST